MNKLRFLNFFVKSGKGSTYLETELKFEETVQKYEIFKVFEKMEMDQKYEKRTYNLRKPINKLRFKKYLKKSETDQK